jgi:hypothetical protein
MIYLKKFFKFRDSKIDDLIDSLYDIFDTHHIREYKNDFLALSWIINIDRKNNKPYLMIEGTDQKIMANTLEDLNKSKQSIETKINEKISFYVGPLFIKIFIGKEAPEYKMNFL